MAEERKFVGTWLKPKEHQDLRELADRNDRSLAAEIRMAIRNRVNTYKRGTNG
jgi:hypothetical protein